jgi:hypothetical protein
MSARPSVTLKKNRSVETLWLRLERQRHFLPDEADSGARLRSSRIWRAAEESGEVLDPLHVVMLGLRR